MKPHKKQTLFGFVGIVMVVFVFKMAGDYRYVTRREAEYKKQPCKRKYERVVDADHVVDCNGDTIKYTWQILKQK